MQCIELVLGRLGALLSEINMEIYKIYSLPCPDFGETQVDTLCSHFAPVLNSAGVCVDNIPDQWTLLKAKIYTEENLHRMSWSEVNRKHKDLCPDVLHLVDLVLSIPASTADCERGFNTMKQVKTHCHFSPSSVSAKRYIFTHLM